MLLKEFSRVFFCFKIKFSEIYVNFFRNKKNFRLWKIFESKSVFLGKIVANKRKERNIFR